MASDSRVHVFEEVVKHNKTNDCWLVINEKVYDVSPFLEEHPGGAEVILSSTGKDATNDFEDVGHSDSAREMMDKYYIGELKTEKVPFRRPPDTPLQHPPQQAALNPDKTTEFVMKILQFLVALFILGLAFAIRHYTKEK